MSNRANGVIRLLKDKNDELIEIMSDIEKKEKLLNMKDKFMGYFLDLSFVFMLLLMFVLVATHILK